MAKRLPGIALLLMQLSTISSAGDRTGQLCWTFDGDHKRVYFAATEGRNDRSSEFRANLENVGIEKVAVSCVALRISGRKGARAYLTAKWPESSIEIIDMTSMSNPDRSRPRMASSGQQRKLGLQRPLEKEPRSTPGL